MQPNTPVTLGEKKKVRSENIIIYSQAESLQKELSVSDGLGRVIF